MSTELVTHAPGTLDVADLDQRIHYAETIAAAGLLPDAFRKNPPNVLIAIEVAATLEESPWTVMQEMGVINGKPNFSAKFMRIRVRKAGHRLRETFENGVATCTIWRSDDPEFPHTTSWDERKARQHELWGKGHWKKNPELMLKNRALSECVREACYEVMGGVAYTDEEMMHDFPATDPRPTVTQHVTAVDRSGLVDAMSTLRRTPAQVEEIAAKLLGGPVKIADLTQEQVDDVTKALIEQAPASDVVDGEVVDETTGEILPEPEAN